MYLFLSFDQSNKRGLQCYFLLVGRTTETFAHVHFLSFLSTGIRVLNLREIFSYGNDSDLQYLCMKYPVLWVNCRIYQPLMTLVREGKIGWKSLDELHAMGLPDLLKKLGT